jgi:hypothetical protein
MSGKVRRVDWSPSEWLAGTRGVLTQRETGVYDCVLNMIYDRGGEAPNDAEFVAGHFKPDGGTRSRQSAAAMTEHTRRALDRLIDLGKLRLTPDGQWLTNGRADTELGKAHGRIIGATHAGFASGRARRAHAKPTPSQRQPNAKPSGSRSSNSNDLTRTSVRNHQPPYDHELDREISSDPARASEPSVGARRTRDAKPDPTLEKLAAEARAKFMKGE